MTDRRRKVMKVSQTARNTLQLNFLIFVSEGQNTMVGTQGTHEGQTDAFTRLMLIDVCFDVPVMAEGADKSDDTLLWIKVKADETKNVGMLYRVPDTELPCERLEPEHQRSCRDKSLRSTYYLCLQPLCVIPSWTKGLGRH